MWVGVKCGRDDIYSYQRLIWEELVIDIIRRVLYAHEGGFRIRGFFQLLWASEVVECGFGPTTVF